MYLIIALLYRISPREIGEWGARKSRRMTPFLEDMDKSLYEKRSPIWNQDLRLMLAETIHRHVPADEDFLRTSNVPPTTSSQSTPKSDSNNSEATTTANEPFKVFQPYSSKTRSRTNIATIPTYPTSSSSTSTTINTSYSNSPSYAGSKRRSEETAEEANSAYVNIKKEETDDVAIKYLAVIVPKVITLLPSLYLPAVIHRSLPFIQILNNNNNP